MIAVTLLVPCYNAARFLPRLMEGVRAQTTPFAAILCYDDGSTDDTVSVARQLGLEIITGNPNRGVSHARNQLVAAARTEWIHFHDADDRISPHFVERLGALADARTDAVCCDADWLDEHNGGLHVAWRYDDAALVADAAAHLLTHPLGLNNSLLRRERWTQIGGCDESLAIWEDADVHFRLALAGARFRHRPEVLTWSMRRSESFSHDYRRNWRCRLQALEGYARMPAAARLRPQIAAQAEKAAEELLRAGDRAGAREAVSFCRALGHRVPTTNHAALKFARTVLPPLTALRLRTFYLGWLASRRSSS